MKPLFKILIVDDDSRIRHTLSDILNLNGYQVSQAASGEEALIKEARFDCVLSDIKMPGINGVELTETLRKTQPGLPVILMTAYATDDLIQRGLQAGVVAIMEKPLDINQLLAYCSFLEKSGPTN